AKTIRTLFRHSSASSNGSAILISTLIATINGTMSNTSRISAIAFQVLLGERTSLRLRRNGSEIVTTSETIVITASRINLRAADFRGFTLRLFIEMESEPRAVATG